MGSPIWVQSYMAKFSSMFISLTEAKEKKIYVSDDFYLDILDQGDMFCRHGIMFDVYHVSKFNTNLLFVS
jgi:hypothetical protein